ncbi:MAG: hypothetical protein FJW39_26020, partial [Acidobacteria bacterium]|nr:hypothetical protein [Acidobacteriota bacterium]
MRLSLFALVIAALALPAGAQQLNRTNVANILGFENGNPGQFPPGWGFTATAAGISNDNTVFHGGRQSARIERTATSPQAFNSLIASIPIDFTGRTFTYRGWIKTEDVSDAVSLWMRADGERTNLAF